MEAVPALELHGVTKLFGEVPAAQAVDLEVRRGEFVTLLGPSGCGKTTILNLIAGFLEPDQGRVVIERSDITGVPAYQRDIGIVFQNYALFPHMSVAENVAFGLRMRRVPRTEAAPRVEAALANVRLEGLGGRRPRELSGGQQQRVALARALVINPTLLLLDEPLSALDKNLRSEMQVELKEIQRRVRVTTVFVTHDQSEALSLSDRIAVISAGRIEQLAPPEAIYRYPASAFVASFIGDINRFKGRIAGSSGAAVSVELESGASLAVPVERARGLAFDAAVWLYLRPEALQLCQEHESALARGRVRNRIFQGTHSELHVETQRLGILHLRLNSSATTGQLHEDALVSVGADPNQALLFPRAGA